MSSYKLIESVLGGIFGAQIGLSDEQAIMALQKNMEQPLFSAGIKKELTEAFSDPRVSWRDILLDQEVCSFDSEDEARKFVKDFLFDVVFGEGRAP